MTALSFQSPIRLGIVVVLCTFLAVALLSGFGRLRGTENMLLAMCYEIRGAREVSDQVLLLSLEDGGISTSEDHDAWSREGLARLVSLLDSAGATVIGLSLPALVGDVMLGPSPAGDEALAKAMRAHGRVVLPMIIRPGSADDVQSSVDLEQYSLGVGELLRPVALRPGEMVAPSRMLADAAAGLGTINIYTDLDGAARQAPLVVSWEGRLYPSFWLELVRISADVGREEVRCDDRRLGVGERTFIGDPQMEVSINYAGGYRTMPRLTHAQAIAMSPEKLSESVQGRVVIIGAELAGITTVLRTPTAPLMPGAEVVATVTENLLAERVLHRLPSWLSLLLALLLSLPVALLVARETPLRGLLIVLIALSLTVTVGFVLFARGVVLPLAPPIVAVSIVGALMIVSSMVTTERERAESETRLQSRLQAIAGIGRLVNSSLDREQLLVEILRWAESEIDAEASSLLMMEPGGEHLRFEVALGEKGETLKDIRLRVGEGIAGTVAATGEPIISQHVQSDDRWSRDVAYAIDYETHSILCVPMMLRDEVIGVIEVLNKRGALFTDRDVQLMQVIGHLSALFLENARLYRTLSMKVDLANEELRQSNERLEFEMARIATLVDEMADGVVATDHAARVVIFNNAAERMFGVPERRAMGRPVFTVFESEELADLFAMPLSPHGGSYETEMTIDEAEGRVVRAHIALIEEPNERSIGKCAVFTDISHLKQLDRMKTDLISFVSHELKNPIASLQGSCRLLQDRLDIEDERTARLLEIAGRQSRRMQYLVQDFLDLSRIEEGQELALSLSNIEDLQSLIEGAISLCRSLGDEHRVRVEVDERTPVLCADRYKIESVLINLIENAAKYSPRGGEVLVRAYPAEDELIIEIHDEGVGIREEDLPKLFRSFQRIQDDTYGEVSGTGVGLYICRHIMRAHGGEITVESEWGRGSTFALHLPLDSDAAAGSDCDE